MFVGVCRVALYLHGNSSLKGKRRVVHSVVERTRAKFNVSVAEVSDNDTLRRAVIGAAVVGNEVAHVDSMLAKIVSFMERLGAAPIERVETEVVPFGDEIGDGCGGWRSSDTGDQEVDIGEQGLMEEEEW